MTDPIEVLRDHTPYDYLGPDPDSVTGEKWGYVPEYLDALAAVVRLRDAARRVGEADNASLAGWGQEADRALREMVEALEGLRDALAPFKEER